MTADMYGHAIQSDREGSRLWIYDLVRYSPRPDEYEYGIVVKVTEDYVFVRFFGDLIGRSKACKASDLEKG